MFFNIVGMGFFSQNNIKLKVGDKINLVKEADNEYDPEAIVLIKDNLKVGYVANSINTVSLGCNSAGRLYDRINAKTEAEVIVIDKHSNLILGKII